MTFLYRRMTFLLFIVFLSSFAGGCLSRRTVIPADQRLLPAQTATRDVLLQKLMDQSNAVDTVRLSGATFDVSSGGETKGILTEYRQTRGYIIIKRPENIHMKLDAPLGIATVFDMVSDGQQYQVSIPYYNKFYVGDPQAPPKSDNPLANLRPQHITQALLVDVRPYVGKPDKYAVLEETVVGRNSYYVFSFIDTKSGTPELQEKLWIDRSNLLVSRKQIFRQNGRLESDVQYLNFQTIGDVVFPQTVELKRPIEDYALKMTFQKIDLNAQVEASAFQLQRPEGAELVRLE